MSSFANSLQTLARFGKDLERLPLKVAQRVAEEAAPELTALTKQTFAAGETPYGDTWAPGKDGEKVTLEESGALERQLRYVAIGTKLRLALGVRYAKYQVGKRRVAPAQGQPLPTAFVRALQRVAVEIVRQEMGGAGR